MTLSTLLFEVQNNGFLLDQTRGKIRFQQGESPVFAQEITSNHCRITKQTLIKYAILDAYKQAFT